MYSLFCRGALGALGGVLVFPGLITYPVGGLIGARSLDRGRKCEFGFAIAFLFLGLAIPVILIAPQGMSGGAWEPLVHFTIAFPIAFGVAGTLGSWVGGLGSRVSLCGGAAFAVGGAVGGLILGLVFLWNIGMRPSSGAGGVAAVIACSAVALVLPHALGGAVIAALLDPIRRSELGLCLKCGYDLRASTGRCPECGEPMAPKLPCSGPNRSSL